MEAKYCKCLNTYTIKKCKRKRCTAPDYWKQGIGSLSGDNGISNVDNQSSERTKNSDRAGLWD